MTLQQVWKVARREYIARVRNKAFVFTTVMVPAFLAGYVIILPKLFEQTATKEVVLAVIDSGTGLAPGLTQWLERVREPVIRIHDVVEAASLPEEVRLDYSERVRNGSLDAYILLGLGESEGIRAQFFARETANLELTGRLSEAFRSAQLERLLMGTSVGISQIRAIQGARVDPVKISEEGESAGGFEVAFISTLLFGMLLYTAVLINGQGMALAIVEEKASRLIEVILGAVTAWEFMSGKIVGVLLSGLTQLAVWVGCSLVVTIFALPALALAAPLEFDLGNILDLEMLAYFSVFFALGYLLYSSLFAAVAATCSSTEELGQAMFPAMMPLILALFATFYAVPNPSSPATVFLSFVPFFSPLVMLARINVLTPPVWEILLSIALLLAGALSCFWLCGKVFRFALLMHGKRPSLWEIVRMIRAA